MCEPSEAIPDNVVQNPNTFTCTEITKESVTSEATRDIIIIVICAGLLAAFIWVAVRKGVTPKYRAQEWTQLEVQIKKVRDMTPFVLHCFNSSTFCFSHSCVHGDFVDSVVVHEQGERQRLVITKSGRFDTIEEEKDPREARLAMEEEKAEI